MPPSQSRRTVVHIDSVNRDDDVAVCTVGGIDLPAGSTIVPLSAFPGMMADEAEPGRVFFAYANLDAERPEDVGVERIERRWGELGPLHFDGRDGCIEAEPGDPWCS